MAKKKKAAKQRAEFSRIKANLTRKTKAAAKAGGSKKRARKAPENTRAYYFSRTNKEGLLVHKGRFGDKTFTVETDPGEKPVFYLDDAGRLRHITVPKTTNSKDFEPTVTKKFVGLVWQAKRGIEELFKKELVKSVKTSGGRRQQFDGSNEEEIMFEVSEYLSALDLDSDDTISLLYNQVTGEVFL